jgi:hypothetical protein
MAAIVSHLGHDASTDVVTCVLLDKLASEHAPTNHGSRLPSRCFDSLHAKSVDSLHQPIRDIMAA